MTYRVLRNLRNALRWKQAGRVKFAWEAAYPDDIDWRAPVPAKPLFAALDDAVAKHPTAACIDFLGKTYTYGELGILVDKATKGFQDLGVRKEIKVGLLLPNTPYYVICYYALLKAGATIVNYNPLYSERELINQIEDSDTEYMITLDIASLYSKLAVALPLTGIRKVIVCNMADILPFPRSSLFPLVKRKERAAIRADSRHVSFGDLVENDGNYEPVDIRPEEDVAVLQYTGGTTGIPKGVMLTHANLYGNTVQTVMWFPGMVAGGEKMLAVLPFFHVFGMTVAMNASIYAGAEIIALPRFELRAVLRAIARKRPTLVAGVPTMYAAINAHKHLAKYDLSSVKFCISGGAPLPLTVKRTFEELTGCKLVEGYGLTEGSPVATCNPFFGLNKEGSIGLPLPGTAIAIAALDNPAKALPPGQKGEICVSGPQVMAGYWRHPEETAGTLVRSRLHTGDVGYMDEDGYTFLIDRIKDLIIVGGYNVYPRAVEEAMSMHPAVEEVAVCGVHDAYRGQIVKAFIKLREGDKLTRREILGFLKDKLARFEMPRRIEFRETLPKTLIGKVSKKELMAEETEHSRKREANR